ncbi:MAG: hypothetical protein KA207_13295 [Burkholderiaceae bacterium]|nr:hypothetical protein [Burkholderiaceae bacterium]
MPLLQALLLTWLVEVPLLIRLIPALPRSKVVLAGLAASLLTHPVAWWAASLLSPHDHTTGVWTIELAVVVTEALWLWVVLRTRALHSLRASAMANTASFVLGWVLWP